MVIPDSRFQYVEGTASCDGTVRSSLAQIWIDHQIGASHLGVAAALLLSSCRLSDYRQQTEL